VRRLWTLTPSVLSERFVCKVAQLYRGSDPRQRSTRRAWGFRFVLLGMTEAAVKFRYRGREISQEDILYIRALIERRPNESRRTLSTRLCEAWQWRQTNGALRDMVCRGLLLMLARAGQITLPPVSYVRHNPLATESGRSRRGSIPRR
jgi:hypothetical protein